MKTRDIIELGHPEQLIEINGGCWTTKEIIAASLLFFFTALAIFFFFCI